MLAPPKDVLIHVIVKRRAMRARNEPASLLRNDRPRADVPRPAAIQNMNIN